METQTCLAVPGENDILHVYCSSQGPQAVRSMLANCLGVPANKLIVETKRAGGAFGAKLSRNFPAAAAVSFASIKLNRPVRIQLDRNTDIENVGKRHPTYGMAMLFVELLSC